jgi:hypothetical protein
MAVLNFEGNLSEQRRLQMSEPGTPIAGSTPETPRSPIARRRRWPLKTIFIWTCVLYFIAIIGLVIAGKVSGQHGALATAAAIVLIVVVVATRTILASQQPKPKGQ